MVSSLYNNYFILNHYTDFVRAFNKSKTENELLKERLKTLEQEQQHKQECMNADYFINDLKKDLKKMVDRVQKFTA